MTRVAFKMRLKPGCEAIYKEKHDAIWPELAAHIRSTGVRNYSIFRIDLDLAHMAAVGERDRWRLELSRCREAFVVSLFCVIGNLEECQ